MLTRILLWALFILLVMRALGRLMRGIAEGASGERSAARGGAGKPPAPARGELMVKDPVCGTFVIQSRALSVRDRSGTQYFCSEKCRQAYTSR
jgi:YHS domain-containing protein